MWIFRRAVDMTGSGIMQWNFKVGFQSLIAASLLGGLSIQNINFNCRHPGQDDPTPPARETRPEPAPPPRAAHRPDQRLWDRLGLTVQDDAEGITIKRVAVPAVAANIATMTRVTRISARVPGVEGPRAEILPAEDVADVEQAESALKRAIEAGDSRGLSEMSISLMVEEPGRPARLKTFPISLGRMLPGP
ncbi:hypothetical protein [Paludisphaera sp.]|uniref:hypothetical protein n=1 Tax=Paludisphaera sp. TaxID=2017432 RepID=UPI00301E4AB7